MNEDGIELITEDLPYPVPDFLNSTDILTISPVLVFAYTVILVAFGILTYLMFRAMDHPRLVLTETPEGLRARRSDVIKYAISMPFLITIWVSFLSIILLFSDNELNVVQLVAWPYAIVLSVRFLAFVLPGAAHELAKLVPLALIALLILSGAVRPLVDVFNLAQVITSLNDSLLTLGVLFTLDYVLTAMWYWGWKRQPNLVQILRRRNVNQAELDSNHNSLNP